MKLHLPLSLLSALTLALLGTGQTWASTLTTVTTTLTATDTLEDGAASIGSGKTYSGFIFTPTFNTSYLHSSNANQFGTAVDANGNSSSGTSIIASDNNSNGINRDAYKINYLGQLTSGVSGVSTDYNAVLWHHYSENQDGTHGNTLRLYNPSATTNQTFTPDFDSTALGGLIVEKDDIAWTFGRGNTTIYLEGNGSVHLTIGASTTLQASDSGRNVEVRTGGDWEVASTKTLTFNTNAVNLAANQAVSMSVYGRTGSETATISIAKAFTMAAGSSISIGEGMTLSVGGAMTATGASITNKGTIDLGTAGTLRLAADNDYAARYTVGTLTVGGRSFDKSILLGLHDRQTFTYEDGTISITSSGGNISWNATEDDTAWTAAGAWVTEDNTATEALRTDNLVFGNSDSVSKKVSVSGDVGALSIALNGDYEFKATEAASISGDFSGSGAFTKTGAGSLTLKDLGTYSGAVTVNGGELVLGSDATLASLTMATGTTLRVADDTNVTISSTATRLYTTAGTYTISVGKGATLDDKGYWRISGGTGTLLVTGEGEYKVSGFTLSTTNSTASVVVDTGATLHITGTAMGIDGGSGSFMLSEHPQTNTVTVRGTLISDAGISNRDGHGNVNIEAGGKLVLNKGLIYTTNGNNDSSIYVKNLGTLAVATADGGTQNQLNVYLQSGATLQAVGTTANIVADFTVTQGAALNFLADAGQTLTIADSMSGAGSLTASGAGIVNLSDINDFCGSIEIAESGTLSLTGRATATTLTFIGEDSKLSLGSDSLLNLSSLFTDKAASFTGGTLLLSEGAQIRIADTLEMGTYSLGALALADATGALLADGQDVSSYLSGYGSRMTATYSATNKQIEITGSGIYELTWAGSESDNTWGKTDSASWVNSDTTNSDTVYADGDYVTFDGTGSKDVNISGEVAPGRILVSGEHVFKGDGRLTGIISLTVAENGDLTLQTDNSNWSGSATLQTGGVLELGHANALGSSTLTFDGGTLRYGSDELPDISDRLTVTAGKSIQVDVNGQSVTWANHLDGQTLVVSSSAEGGVLTLSNTTRTGNENGNTNGLTAITIQGGTLKLTNNYSLKISGNIIQTAISMSGGELSLTNEGASGGYLYANANSGASYLFLNDITLTPDEDETIIISGTDAGFGFASNGKGVIYNSINGGTATISANLNTTGTSGGTRDIHFTISESSGATDGVEVDFTGDMGSASNNEADQIRLVKKGDGTLRLNGSTYIESITVQEGTLIANSATALGPGDTTLTVGNSDTVTAATLELESSGSVKTLNGTSHGTITTNSEEAVTLTVGDGSTTAGSSSFAGALQGNINLALAANANLTLSGDNSYSGSTTLGSGSTLTLGHANALGSTSGITVDGGKLVYNASGVSDFSSKLTIGTNGVSVDVNDQHVEWDGTLTDSKALTLSSTAGDGVLTLDNITNSGSAGNSHGLTSITIQSGTLKLTNNYALKVSSNVIQTAITMNGGELNLTMDAGSNGFYYRHGSNSALGNAGYTYIFSNSITLTPGENKTITISADTVGFGFSTNNTGIVYNSTNGGMATISANINSTGTNGSDRTNVFNIAESSNAEIEVDFTGDMGSSATNVETAKMILSKQGAGTLRLSGNTYIKKINVQEGTLIAAKAGSLGTGSTALAVGTSSTATGTLKLAADSRVKTLSGNEHGVITSTENAKLTITNSDSTAANHTYAGSIQGKVALDLEAAATLVLSGSNTSEGNTVIAKAATLTLGEAMQLTGAEGSHQTEAGVYYGTMSGVQYDATSIARHESYSGDYGLLEQLAVTVTGNSASLSGLSLVSTSVTLNAASALALSNMHFDDSSYLTGSGVATLADVMTFTLGASDMGTASATGNNYSTNRLTGLTLGAGAVLTLDGSNMTSLAAGDTITLSGVDASAGTVLLTNYTVSQTSVVDGNTVITIGGSAAVPEPTTATLSLLALAALCARRRRRS